MSDEPVMDQLKTALANAGILKYRIASNAILIDLPDGSNEHDRLLRIMPFDSKISVELPWRFVGVKKNGKHLPLTVHYKRQKDGSFDWKRLTDCALDVLAKSEKRAIQQKIERDRGLAEEKEMMAHLEEVVGPWPKTEKLDGQFSARLSKDGNTVHMHIDLALDTVTARSIMDVLRFRYGYNLPVTT